MHNIDLENFMERLFEVGCVKFGDFLLSSGLKTPVYILFIHDLFNSIIIHLIFNIGLF